MEVYRVYLNQWSVIWTEIAHDRWSTFDVRSGNCNNKSMKILDYGFKDERICWKKNVTIKCKNLRNENG